MLTATIGLCLRGGDVARGQSCTFEPGHCMLREDVTSCAVGDICTGTTGSATGTCGRLCDPRAAGGCDNGQTCLAFSGGANVAGVCR